MKQLRIISFIIIFSLILFFVSVFIVFRSRQSAICQPELSSDNVRILRTEIAYDISRAQTKQLVFRLSASELNSLLLPSLTEQGFIPCMTISHDDLSVLLIQNPLIWFTAELGHLDQKPFLAIEQLFLWFIPLPSSVTDNANKQLANGFVRFEETSTGESAWTITNIEVTDNSVFITMDNGR